MIEDCKEVQESAKGDANHEPAESSARYPGGVALLAGSNPGESHNP